MKIFRQIKFGHGRKLSPFTASLADFLSDVIVIFVLVLLIIKPFFFAPFRVQQQSMTPNVLDGEFIVVWKTPYLLGEEYERNDIIVFQPPSSENFLIKRVIGLPGETIRIFDGFTWVQNAAGEFEKLDEGFLALSNLGNTCLGSGFCSDIQKSQAVDFEVPAGEYFVLGDNRVASRDSRSCFQARCSDDSTNFLQHSEIEGRAVLTFARIWAEDGERHFSVTNTRLLTHPNSED
ncbi:MAG: signal peptidase I [Candidatus Peribacteraceae bacterium]|nr:signal peptidase I [Candidatus Peribacteraceae bacterium]